MRINRVSSQSTPGSVTGDKTITPGDIQCNGTATVTISLTGENGISGSPTDIMLVLDRSGSMREEPISSLKIAANKFVDIIDEGTDNLLDGIIANGSRIGVVSFATTPTLDVPLTSNANLVKSAINALTAAGNTNHSDPIALAQAQLVAGGSANRIMIIMTDGETTVAGKNGIADRKSVV